MYCFPRQKYFRERASILRYTYIACLVETVVLRVPIQTLSDFTLNASSKHLICPSALCSSAANTFGANNGIFNTRIVLLILLLFLLLLLSYFSLYTLHCCCFVISIIVDKNCKKINLQIQKLKSGCFKGFLCFIPVFA
jgi:hypothetical protein